MAHVLSDKCFVFELGLETFKPALAQVTDVLDFLKPPECHLADKVVSTLLRIVLLHVVGSMSQEAHILGGDYPCVGLRAP